MKPFASACLALVSVAAGGAVVAASRPHYGGTLRVETAGIIRSVDPAAQAADPAEAAARSRILPLVFETLTAIDGDGTLHPGLAVSWEIRGGRAQFRIRHGVALHDGSMLEAWQVATSLRAADPSWTIEADGDIVTIDRGPADVAWELARVRNAVAVHGTSGVLVGTGPFRVDHRDDRRLILRANDDYWNARPFLDAIVIGMGAAPAEQLASIERGASDLVPARPLDVRRLAQLGVRAVSSRPLDLVALVFEPPRSGADDAVVRSALAAAVDRQTLAAVLLQQHAVPARALLPQWISGYAPPDVSVPARVRETVAARTQSQRTLTVRVDPGDAVAQAIAERIVVNAREAGFTVTVQAPSGLAPRADARIVRVPLEPSTPDRVLSSVIAALGPRVAALAANDVSLPPGSGPDVVQRVERALLEHQIIVPLVHLPDLYAIGDRVHVWNGPALLPSGALNLANVWIE